MNPTQTNQPSHKQKVDNALTATQVGEEKIFTVHRHPIGLFGTYAICGALTIAVAVLAFSVAPGSNNTAAAGLAMLAFFFVALLCIGFSFVVTKIYWGNSWILTSDSVTQVAQSTLFNRESSQLSLGNLEDISAEQKGILQHMFNYGLLKVETAGEKSKFAFDYCPNPNYYAQQVLMAREHFEQSGHSMGIHHLRTDKANPAASTDEPSKPTFLDPDTVEFDPEDPTGPNY